jgi:hypothetical protein
VNQNNWREILKSGPLSRAYAAARLLKRRLRGEPLGGVVPTEQRPLPLEDLHRLAEEFPHNPRIQYSLALAWLERDGVEGVRRAVEHLDAAERLGFEGAERLALYRALAAVRSGNTDAAVTSVAGLRPYDLTPEEKDLLREAVLSVPTA